MENKNSNLSNVSIGIGGTLIITIFVVLCLTVFSVLSFTTAYSDLKLANKSEKMAYEYYEVHGKAEEKLAQIHTLLTSSENIKDTVDAAEMLSEVNGSKIIQINDDSLKISYESLGNKNQKIIVTLNIMYDKEKNEHDYNIETWNLSAIELPVYEVENFDLWEGFE